MQEGTKQLRSGGLAVWLAVAGVVAGAAAYVAVSERAVPDAPAKTAPADPPAPAPIVASPDWVVVDVAFPGADPYGVEQLLLSPLEAALEGLVQVESVHGFALEGHARVVLEPVTAQTVEELREATRAVLNTLDSLPAEAESPQLRIQPQLEHVTVVTVSGDFELELLSEAARRWRDVFLRTSGVASVELLGASTSGLRVMLDPERLAMFAVTRADVVAALSAESVEFGPQGQLDDVDRVVVRAMPDGTVLRIADLGRIEHSLETRERVSWEGRPAVAIALRGTSAVHAAVREALADADRGPTLEALGPFPVRYAPTGDRVDPEHVTALRLNTADGTSAGDALPAVHTPDVRCLWVQGGSLLPGWAPEGAAGDEAWLFGDAAARGRAVSAWERHVAARPGVRLERVPGGPQAIVELVNPELDFLEMAVEAAERSLFELEGVVSVARFPQAPRTLIRFRLKPEGVSSLELSAQLRDALEPNVDLGWGTIKLVVGDGLPVRRAALNAALPEFVVRTPQGPLPLRELADLVLEPSPSVIYRHRGERRVILQVTLSPGSVADSTQHLRAWAANQDLPARIRPRIR